MFVQPLLKLIFERKTGDAMSLRRDVAVFSGALPIR